MQSPGLVRMGGVKQPGHACMHACCHDDDAVDTEWVWVTNLGAGFLFLKFLWWDDQGGLDFELEKTKRKRNVRVVVNGIFEQKGIIALTMDLDALERNFHVDPPCRVFRNRTRCGTRWE